MIKFSPLNLRPYFNSGSYLPEWHPAVNEYLHTLPRGEQEFWGVPFEISDDEASRLIVLDKTLPKLTIPLHSSCGYLVFVHFCDQSHDPDGLSQPEDYKVGEITRPGEHIAEYVLHYGDGREFRKSIRRRFEISEMIMAFGLQSFAARSHIEPEVLDWRGPYDQRMWGRYQTGVGPVPNLEILASIQYWIYAMENPFPENEIEFLSIKSEGGSKFAIGAVTLYKGNENPLRHGRRVPLQITLNKPKPLVDLKTSIDLGLICRRYLAQEFDADGWLQGLVRGWGEEEKVLLEHENYFIDVSANPEATLNIDGEDLQLNSVLSDGYAQSESGEIRVQLVEQKYKWMKVKVIDAQTQQTTPTRIHFRSHDGRYLPPCGHRAEVNDNWFEDYGGDLKLGSTEYAYVDGEFQIELPVGEVYVEVAKGFEYQPSRRKIDIKPDMEELSLSVERICDWRGEGWVTADVHVHFVNPQTAWLEAQAEGVNVVNILASQWGNMFTNVADFTGEISGVSQNDTLIWVGLENRHHMLGHMNLLGVKGEPIFPMCGGGPLESAIGDPTWSSMAEWADLCREKDGLAVLPHFPVPYCEAVADIALNKIDAVEIRYFTERLEGFNVKEWYRFLNCGYRLPAVGGTDKMSAGMPIGGVRTYADLRGNEFTFENWAEAVRSGRTFTTSGPLIGLSVEDISPGGDLFLPDDGGSVEFLAWVESTQPFHILQVVMNGQVIAEETYDAGVLKSNMHGKIKINASGWIAARCISHHKVWHSWPIHIAAHTSPVYVHCGEREALSNEDILYMLTILEGGVTWLDTLSAPANPECLMAAKKVFLDAEDILRGRIGNRHHH
jgi:hypothetical protein